MALRLAGTVATAVAKALLAPRPGAGLVRDPVRRPAVRPRKGADRKGTDVHTDRLAKALARRLQSASASASASGSGSGSASGHHRDLPEHERAAAAEAVGAAFAAAGPLDATRIFDAALDPDRLRRELPDCTDGLSERARSLYDELLRLCCAHAVEQITADPSFAARAAVEQTRRSVRTEELVRDLAAAAPRPPEARALSFEERYAGFMADTLGRLELFGLTLGRAAPEWSLETAYISLSVSGLSVSGDAAHRGGLGLPGTEQTVARAEQVLAGADRVVLRGPAGSGKSTLVQWLAVNAARRGFGGDLEDWNRCVPFVLRLRAFTASGTLPTPDEFLRAAGVPFHGSAPDGWAESLLTSGRALVLVDGVDEVPARLRQRTEAWLKSLIAAFPEARYVVTTRPSAVPDDWLTRHGFSAHSLLPMDRDDIRVFLGHWHAANRVECRDSAERQRLERYEESLRHAVSTRRDLARLATNPLMCALLCALNRDRRMQLPRARKELYDAALDMLLVRRDTEREVSGVEGVYLTREEQTSLLQKFAYWLIRNDQLQADRADVEELFSTWLAAMPQVQGTPEQVFTHLLIRSGLLREPLPDTVDFVHRTFRDYLGARAAVDERDFGQLVRNAHDDQWDDVVQMAVGHARPQERASLIKKLLRRADHAPKLRHRLVLLAAACLEHAPELDPAVRRQVEDRTKALLPPQDLDAAEELAKVGELALELLAGSVPEELTDAEAAAVVRTAGLVKGDTALGVITRFAGDARPRVAIQVSEAWSAFEAVSYARDVLAAGQWDEVPVQVRTKAQLRALPHVPQARYVQVIGNHADLTPLREVPDLEEFATFQNPRLIDLTPLAAFRSLKGALLSFSSQLRDLTPLVSLPLTWLSLFELHYELDLAPLAELTTLRRFSLGHPVLMENVTELPLGEQLMSLSLYRQARYLDLAGIDQRWPHLARLTLASPTQLAQLSRIPWTAERLTHLSLRGIDPVDLTLLSGMPGLRGLDLLHCGSPSGPPVDLTPLADRPDLAIKVSSGTNLLGAELFPPERLTSIQ